jgi:NADH-quinone oxidoreductase subunit N
MWCPDVYQGAPTPVAALFSVVPKAAGFALAYRFLVGGIHPEGELAGVARWLGDVGPAGTWTLVVGVLAAATMTVGNLAALAQTDMKRLLAYSSIAHAGTLLMALAVGSDQACEAMLLYLGVYLFMNLTAFLVVIAVTERGVGESLADFKGLGRRAPLAAFCLVLALFSLTGLPPTAGFVAKYAIFAVVIRRGLDGGGAPLFLLAVLGVLNTVVSLVYYARIIRLMILDQPTESSTSPLRLTTLHTGLLAATALPVLALGIYAAPLADLARRSISFWPSP